MAQLELIWPLRLAGLALLPVLGYLAWRGLVNHSPPRRLAALGCRITLVATVVLALTGPRWVQKARQLYVVLAVDQSESVLGLSDEQVAEFVGKSRPWAADHRTAWLPFGATPGEVVATAPVELAANERRASNLAAAIETAAAVVPDGYLPRVVLFSDGLETEGDARAAARAAGVPVWTVPLEPRCDPEVYVAAVEVRGPTRVGVPLEVEVRVQASRAGQGTVELSRGEQIVETRNVQVEPDENRFRFATSVSDLKPVRFVARVDGFEDTISENNTAAVLVVPEARPRVLLVESRPTLAEHLVTALAGREMEVDVRSPGDFASSADSLRRYDLLVLSNVPAAALGAEKLPWIRDYVGTFGGGLIAIGGMEAFTAGGYHGTALEEALPVVCQASGRRRKPSLAMVLVIDRSMSMKGAAIDLAKQATRRAVEMLDAQDQVGVLAFDEVAQWISPLGPCADISPILKRIDTIEARGRTDTFPALERAYLALDEALADRKHIILLTDGISHPGDFEALARQIAESRITLSTVAVGKEAAGPLLESLARIGHGRYYYCDDPAAVPRIFARDTASAGQAGISEEPFFAKAKRASSVLAGIDLEHAPTLLGYVETQPKARSQLILASELGDPLLIWWRYGRGISVAFTSDVETRWAATWLGWPGFGPFWTHLVRHAMRRDPARGFRLRVEPRSGRAVVTLDAADPQGKLINGAEGTLEASGSGRPDRESALAQIAPGRYAADLPTPGSGEYLFTVRLRHAGRQVYTARHGLVVGFPDELRTRSADLELLRSVAELSGGRYEPTPEELFEPGEETVRRDIWLWPYLLAAAAVLLVVDVALRSPLGLKRAS